MVMCARDVMRVDPMVARPGTTLPDLEQLLLSQRIGGLPVVDDGKLVGVVSRSDIVRKLGVEQVIAEQVAEFHRELAGYDDSQVPDAGAAEQVSARLEGVKVRDIMVEAAVTVAPDQPLREVAATLCERKVHRVPVVEHGRLVGIITTLDLVNLIAGGTFAEK